MMDHNNKCIVTNQTINSMRDAASMLSKKLHDVANINSTPVCHCCIAKKLTAF